MTLLWAARWTLLASIALYGLGLVIGYPLGLLMGIAGTYAMSLAALACVVIQVVQALRRKRPQVGKSP